MRMKPHASCFNDAIGAAERCLIECDPRLVGLFQRSFPDAAVREVKERAKIKTGPIILLAPQDPKVDVSIRRKPIRFSTYLK